MKRIISGDSRLQAARRAEASSKIVNRTAFAPLRGVKL